jgi:hypothetical protein
MKTNKIKFLILFLLFLVAENTLAQQKATVIVELSEKRPGQRSMVGLLSSIHPRLPVEMIKPLKPPLLMGKLR